MDVKTVCLGLLSFGDASGYDIKKHFEATVDHFFATGFGSIYPALASLADEGLVTCTTVPQEGRPERKVYRITPEGDAVLRRTLASEEPTHRVRSELLALLYFAHLVPPARISELMDERIAAMEIGLRHMRASACPAEHRWPSNVRFVQGFGAALLEAGLNYMKQNRHLLEDGHGAEPGGTDSRQPSPTQGRTRRVS
jgi:PadR family transcriptional regulator, regulatory protein AphA